LKHGKAEQTKKKKKLAKGVSLFSDSL